MTTRRYVSQVHLGCSCRVRRGPTTRHSYFIIVSSDIAIVAGYIRPPRSPRARQLREFSTTCLRRLKRRGPFPCGYNRCAKAHQRTLCGDCSVHSTGTPKARLRARPTAELHPSKRGDGWPVRAAMPSGRTRMLPCDLGRRGVVRCTREFCSLACAFPRCCSQQYRRVGSVSVTRMKHR